MKGPQFAYLFVLYLFVLCSFVEKIEANCEGCYAHTSCYSTNCVLSNCILTQQLSGKPACCSSSSQCSSLISGNSYFSECSISLCYSPYYLCVLGWRCSFDFQPPPVVECNGGNDCASLANFCVNAQCTDDYECELIPKSPLPQGCCNHDSDCTAVPCGIGYCEPYYHTCVYDETICTYSSSSVITLSPTKSKTVPPPSRSPSVSPSSSESGVTILTQSNSPTKTSTKSLTPSRSITSSRSLSNSVTASISPSLSVTRSISISRSISGSISRTPTVTSTPSHTATSSPSFIPSISPSLSETATKTESRSITPSSSTRPSKSPSRSTTPNQFVDKIVIDAFTTQTDPKIIITLTDYAPPEIRSTSFDVNYDDSTILGNERDIIFIATEGSSGATFETGVTSSGFTITTPPLSASFLQVQYDGIDGDEELDYMEGLSGVNLRTELTLGLKLVAQSDFETDIVITIHDSDYAFDSVTVTIPVTDEFTTYLLPFSLFQEVDVTSVNAIVFSIFVINESNLILYDFSTYGSPSSVTPSTSVSVTPTPSISSWESPSFQFEISPSSTPQPASSHENSSDNANPGNSKYLFFLFFLLLIVVIFLGFCCIICILVAVAVVIAKRFSSYIPVAPDQKTASEQKPVPTTLMNETENEEIHPL